jgi:hypothetical protein
VREKLEALRIVAKRHAFRATVDRTDLWYDRPVVLLLDIRLVATGKQQCDHVWTKSKRLIERDFGRGTLIEFTASITPYTRGDGSEDYRLADIRAIAVVEGRLKHKGTLRKDLQ